MNDNPPPADPSKLPPIPPQLPAMLNGQQKFTKMTVPVLAIFAYRHQLPSEGMLQDEGQRRAAGGDAVFTEEHAEALKAVVPSSRIVRIPNADHFVFKSNESAVLRELNEFIDSLPISRHQSSKVEVSRAMVPVEPPPVLLSPILVFPGRNSSALSASCMARP